MGRNQINQIANQTSIDIQIEWNKTKKKCRCLSSLVNIYLWFDDDCFLFCSIRLQQIIPFFWNVNELIWNYRLFHLFFLTSFHPPCFVFFVCLLWMNMNEWMATNNTGHWINWPTETDFEFGMIIVNSEE